VHKEEHRRQQPWCPTPAPRCELIGSASATYDSAHRPVDNGPLSDLGQLGTPGLCHALAERTVTAVASLLR